MTIPTSEAVTVIFHQWSSSHLTHRRSVRSLLDYEKKNSRPIWNTTKFVKVDNFADFSKQSYPDGVNVLANIVIEKPTYVTFTYGDGTGDKKGQSWSY